MRTHRHYFVDGPSSKRSRSKALLRLVKESYYKLLSWRASQYFFMPDALVTKGSGITLDTINWISENRLPNGVWELVCHPSTTTEGLYGTSLLEARIREYKTLANPHLRSAIGDLATLINFSELGKCEELRGEYG